MRLFPRLLTALAVVLVGLTVPALVTAPATALDQPCVRTYTTTTTVNIPAKTVVFPGQADSKLTVDAVAPVQDVNITVNITHASVGKLSLKLNHLATSVNLSNNRGGDGDNFTNTTFDDEATTPIASGTAPFTGTFQPDGVLGNHDGHDAPGEWVLHVENGGAKGTIDSWSVRIRFGECDFDGDGLLDKDDNCPDVANPSQLDTDDDKQGDACDTDDDNDGLNDGADNCDTVPNLDQKDSDRDGAGNACDGDDDNDGKGDAVDKCPTKPASTKTGCPVASRRVTIGYSDGAFRGRVYSNVQRCEAFIKVRVMKAVSGPDIQIDFDQTDLEGDYEIQRARRRGEYYAIATPLTILGQAECPRVESARLRLR